MIKAIKNANLSGFTLIEILVAVCVIAFGALVAVTMHVSSMKGKSVAANMTYAAAIAETELERLKTLPFNEVLNMSNNEVANLDHLSQICETGEDCSKNIFTRKTRFFPKNPTTFSCHVEIEVDWKDSSGAKSLLYSAVISSTSFS
jgi:prepilin-type N-terminal cleavage/methylation domain-containing protein